MDTETQTQTQTQTEQPMNTANMTDRDLRIAASEAHADGCNDLAAELDAVRVARHSETPADRNARRVARALANRPKVGDGASFTIATDTRACTVTAVSKNGKTVTMQEDNAELLNGFKSGEADALNSCPGGFAHHVSGRQRYNFTPNPAGSTYKVSLRKNGAWKLSGHPATSPGCVAHFNGRHHHYDYNF